MTDLVPAPNHGARLSDEQGKSGQSLQLFIDAIGLYLNANRALLNDYTVATVPAAETAYGLIMVTDEAGGAVTAFSDLTNWRRTTDRAIIS